MTALILTELAAIGLEELVARADLQRRFDVKFLVANRDVPTLIEQLSASHTDVRVLQVAGQREHASVSCYFDTPTLALHQAQAQGRRRRVKVRTRRYGLDGPIFLEVKGRDGAGRTTKWRTAHGGPDPATLGPHAADQLDAWLGASGNFPPVPDDLAHTATVSFKRITLLIDGAERLTVDQGLGVQVGDKQVDLGGCSSIVETKADRPLGGTARTLFTIGHHPVAVSKYALALTAAHPTVRGNRWRHVVRRLSDTTAAVHSQR